MLPFFFYLSNAHYLPCTCKLSTAVRSFKDHKYVICFFKGLNDNFSNVRTQILLIEKIPSFTKFNLWFVNKKPHPIHLPLILLFSTIILEIPIFIIHNKLVVVETVVTKDLKCSAQIATKITI